MALFDVALRIREQEEALNYIKVLYTHALKSIKALMTAHNLKEIDIQGFKIPDSSYKATYFKEKDLVEGVFSELTKVQVETIHSFVIAYPTILKALTEQIIISHNEDLQVASKTLEDLLVEEAL